MNVYFGEKRGLNVMYPRAGALIATVNTEEGEILAEQWFKDKGFDSFQIVPGARSDYNGRDELVVLLTFGQI
jgi:hypothetical protein